jgi:sigma-B regulation protein RsbU (phosphoserine phosphatase)
LTYASAGHPGGYLLGPDGTVKQILKRTGLPLGIRPDGVFEAGIPVDLQAGDMLVMVTDGFEEATAPDGMPFGVNRALAIVKENYARSAQEIVEALYRGVRAFAQGEAQVDDLTAVVVKVHA